MTEFKCDTRSHGNFLYGKKQSVFIVYTGCIIIVRHLSCYQLLILKLKGGQNARHSEI